MRDTLTRVGSFVLAGGLLYLALRNVDFARVAEDLKQANYWWLAPIVLVTLFSHWLRAWRWTFLLSALPPREHGTRVDTLGAFGAVMMGYLANYLAPRIGEVVRTANVARRYRHGFVPVFGTVITERVLDVVTMALAFGTLPLVFSGRLAEIRALLLEPLEGRIPEVSPLLAALVTLVGVGLVYGLVRWIRTGHGARIARMAGSLRDGLVTVARTPRRVELVVSTVLIWMAYGMMAYLPFVMFGFHEAYAVGPIDAWGLMLLGAIGVLLPSPGGIGSYHYITIQSLVLLYGFPSDAAASYAILTHTGQLVIYVITGAFFVYGMGFRVAVPDESASPGSPAANRTAPDQS